MLKEYTDYSRRYYFETEVHHSSNKMNPILKKKKKVSEDGPCSWDGNLCKLRLHLNTTALTKALSANQTEDTFLIMVVSLIQVTLILMLEIKHQKD